jgi:hypothetical protein
VPEDAYVSSKHLSYQGFKMLLERIIIILNRVLHYQGNKREVAGVNDSVITTESH